MINAECHSDDRVREAQFDATLWFEQASDEEILALARCDWGGDYPADQVAMFMAEHNQDVADMFKYIELVGHRKDAPGFECHVDELSAALWIRRNKEHLLYRLEEGDR